MVSGININLFDFQEKAVIKLLDIVTDSRSKQTVIVKSPTGSGKTIILIDFIDHPDRLHRRIPDQDQQPHRLHLAVPR